MDLHRLRVVGFDTSVREKEHEKKNNVQLEEHKKEDGKTSTIGNRDQIGDENLSLYDKIRTPELLKKYDEEISHQGISKNYLCDTSDLPGTSTKIDVNDEVTPPKTTKQYQGDKLCPPGTSEKYLNDTTSTSHIRTLKSQRTKSEIFKIPPRKKTRKRAVKINSSDIGLTKLIQNSAYSHQKKRTINLPNRNRNAKSHYKEENVKEKKETIEDVHFLFARETPSFIRYRRKRAENERTNKTRNSKPFNDIYGFQKSNRSMNQYQMSFLNFIDTDKLPFKKMRIGFHRKRKPPSPSPVTNCYCKHHAMRVLNSACGNIGSRPIYYNLGTHPHPRRSHQKRDSDQEGFKRERSYCMAKDKTVEVSPSLFSPVCKSLRDTGTGPSKGELYALEKSTTVQNFTVANEYNQKPSQLPSTPSPCAAYTAFSQRLPCELQKSQTFQDVTRTSEGDQKPSPKTSAPTPCTLCAARTTPPQKKCKKKRKKTIKSFFIFTLCNEYLSRLRLAKLITDFHIENKISGKNCIKYVFFGLLIVVWSPCLLAVILAWIVMFPWKLTNLLKPDVTKRSFPMNNSFKNRLRKNNLRCEYQRMCFENYLPEKKKSFMTLTASFISRTVGVVVNSFNAVVSLLKFKRNVPMGASSSFLPSCHPNPRKRYKLFYADNRGWVMKPLRRRTRSCASNRVLRSMRCEFRPKLRQESRGQNLKMTSLNKVHCLAHETCSNLRHQCSPAGDACLVQSKDPCPCCVCRDEYSQLPTTSKPLNSHHRRKQVNILSAFCYPTSGIALISTNEKVINPNNLNSNEIYNSVSHKDLAKDYRGIRNNGTPPFERVFNYPCGAKPPLTTNFETCRANKLGLSGKTLNMSTYCTSRVLLKGLQGQFPKYWTKYKIVNALHKAPGVHRITSSKQNKKSMSSCKLNKLQLRGHITKVLNCPFAGNQKLPITNKDSRIFQKNINFCNKSILTNTLSQSTLTKQANTSTYKLSYAHKTQNTNEHMSCQKVRNKSKTIKCKADKASKCACRAKRLPAKQEFKYKNRNHVTSEEKPSTAKIKSSIKHNIILNYSLENRRKQSTQSYKYKPDLIPVATEMLLNTADVTPMTKQDITLKYSCGKKYEEFKDCYEHKPHQMSFATQKQLCTADITTSTNRDVALNGPCKENHGLSKHDYKRKPNQIPVETQMQSRTAHITTSTNRNVALNCPCKENHRLSKHDYKRKPNQIPVETQMQSRTADITTSTNRNVALNCPCKGNHRLPKHYYKRKPNKIPVATQMQSRTADITTSTNRNVALNCPSKENYRLSKHYYKRKPNKISVETQMQPRTADITTSTNRNVAVNCPCEQIKCFASTADKESKYIQDINLSESIYKYIPGQISVATQKQSSTFDITTMTNRDTALNYPYKYKQLKHAYNYIPDDSIPDSDILHACFQSTTGKDTASNQNSAPEYLSKSQDISLKKQSYKIDASVNCVSDYENSKIKDFFSLEPILSPNKNVDYIDATISWEKTIDTECPKRPLPIKMIDCGCRTTLKPAATATEFLIERQADENIFAQHPTEVPPSLKNSFVGGTLEVRRISTAQPLSTRQMEEFTKKFRRHANNPLFGIASDCRFGLTPQVTQVSNLQADSQKLKIALAFRCSEAPQQNERDKQLKQKENDSKSTYSYKTSSAKEPPNKHLKLTQAPSPLFVIAPDCVCGTNQQIRAKRSSDKDILIKQLKVSKESHQHDSGTTPITNTQKLTSDPETAHPLKTRIVTKSLPTSTNIQEMIRDYKCEYNTVPPLKSKFSEHIPSAQLESLIPSKRNIDRPRSQFPKSIERTRPSKSLLHRRCPESPQDAVDSAKLSTFPSKKKLQKSSEHAKPPPQKYLHSDCTCLVKSLIQGPESKSAFERPRKSFFGRKSKHNSIDIPNDCPGTSTQNYLNKISFISDIPVKWQTTKQSLIRSCGRNETRTCSVNEPSSRVQSSRISLYSSKVSSLVMSLRSKLLSRKSNQTKISKKSTKKPPSVIVPSLQVKPKKVDYRDISINDMLESILDVESNPPHPLSLHSRHSSCSSVIHKSPLRQCTKKNRYIHKPMIADKSYACLHNKVRTFQHPSFLSHECRSQSTKVNPRVSRSIISQQSKTSKHSSIVTLFTRKLRSKSQSEPIKSSQKFDPQYSSSLMNCQQTPTARQALLQELPPGPNTLKSKRSFLFNRLESKPLVEKLRSISDKISENSHIKKQINKSSTSPHKGKKQFDAMLQQPKVDQGMSIIHGKCRCAREQKFVKQHLSYNKQFEAIPHQLKAKKIKPVISGRCRCAGNQNNIENSSNNKLLPDTDVHNFTLIRPIKDINTPPLRTVKSSKFFQHLALKLPAPKLTQLQSCQQPIKSLSSSLYNFQSVSKRFYKCRCLKHSNDLEVANSLHKIAKKRISHQSTNKFQKSHLISHTCSCIATTKQLREHKIVQRPDISQSAGIQPNLQFQIYQQNLPDQKRIIQSPTNVDKQSCKLLQQHSDAPGHAQKSTTEGEVRQPYPDFNRVSMRYPALNKTSLEQSLQIRGINRPPPTKNYPPAPGATPSPNYACDPCNTIPPCGLKSPYDESALRRAYKRRPLRYTPPRQQLPCKVVMVRTPKENKQKCAKAKRRKEKQQKQNCLQCLRHLVNKTEREVWSTEFKCHPKWLNAKKVKPKFLNGRKACRSICKMFVYFLTLCFWSPILCCAYLCCNVLCKCCA